MKPRTLATLVSLTLVSPVTLVIPPAGAAPPDPTLVHVDTGSARGKVTGDTVRFSGLPYAAPPVGELRWTAPRRPQPWTGVRDATVPRDRCAQSGWDPTAPVDGSEDCLYVDVTRPVQQSRPGRMPVIVFLHGGRLISGSGSDFDGSRLATTGDAVVVTANYRLGALGFLSSPALDAEGTVSGNYGLLDQAEVLRWVRRNAAAFGGDPFKVTLAGQSAGARSVCTHLASPASRGLFQRAIVQSGACANTVMTKSAADRKGAQAIREVGCAGAADLPGCLRQVPVARLLGTLADVGTSVTGVASDDPWGPVAGTPFLPWQPITAIRYGSAAGIPLLIGSMRDEMRTFVAFEFDLGGDPLTAEEYAAEVQRAFGSDAPAVLDRYPVTNYASPVLALSAVLTDWGGWIGACPTLRTARTAARHAPVFAYELADDSRWAFGGFPLGAFHGWDLPFLWSVPWAVQYPPFTPAQQRLSDTMIGYWTAFARNGDPNAAGLPRWRPVGVGGEVLGLTAERVGPTPYAADHHCGFWSSR
jgi:para-nitrobenzyl esterase